MENINDIKLPYSDEEILCLYKESKDKRKQLKILSELNSCSEEIIRQVLLRVGLDGRALPRKPKEQNKEPQSNTTDNDIQNNENKEQDNSYSMKKILIEIEILKLESQLSSLKDELSKL